MTLFFVIFSVKYCIMNKIDKYYIGGGRKRIIDTYFNGVEQSTIDFNNTVYDIWLKEESYKRTVKISLVLAGVSLVFGILGFVL